MIAASALTLAACGNNSEKSASKESKIVTKLDKTTKITFWHAMNGAQEKALTKIVGDFEKKNPKIKVELQNQSSYPDLQAKINSTLASPKDLPTITQAYPGWLYDAAGNDMLVDLKPYMDNETIGWGKQEQIKSSLLKGAQIKDVQYGIPFNKSTEVLVYNKDMFEKYGITKVPTNFTELKAAAKKIYEGSNHEVAGLGFDSLNNYYAIGMKNAGVDLTKSLKLDSKKSQDVVNYYQDGIKAGYFRIPGSDKYMSGPFANEKVAMYIGSMAGEGFTKKDTEGKFEYGVAARPAKWNISQGTDIYMFNKATADQKTAAFLLLKYLASPDAQLYFAQQTGYMPIVESVMKSKAYTDSDMKTPKVIANATKNLFSIPVTKNADPAYNELRTIMEKIFSDKKANVKQILKDSQAEFNDAWNQ